MDQYKEPNEPLVLDQLPFTNEPFVLDKLPLDTNQAAAKFERMEQ